MCSRLCIVLLFSLACFSFCTGVTAQGGYKKTIIKEGIRVDVSISHVSAGKPADEFREGDDVRVHFKVSDTVSGKGLAGASPAAWMDIVKNDQKVDCGKKIKSFIEGDLFNRPSLDLNTYYVFTLNGDNTINVVNPLFGFGGSQLLTQIQLPAPGYDWVAKDDQSIVFVSMPEASGVAFISTPEMKNLKNLTLPGHPGKLFLQADEHYLWVAYDLPGAPETKSGVAVIDAENNTLVKTIITGSGPHEFAADEDHKHVYVSNPNEGTISVIDMNALKKTEDIDLKDEPLSMAWSVKAGALYVVNKKNPEITVIDGRSLQIIKKIKSEAGINKITFSPGGRNGFVINPQKNTVVIIDAASNRIVQTADVEAQPDEITFTDQLVFVRHRGSDIISMIPMNIIGQEGVPVSAAQFSSGQNPPAKGSPDCGALGIVQVPGDNSVLISNYKDESIYYYQEGMAAPMGSFNCYGKNPKAVLIVDRSIKEKGDGEYETVAKLGNPGTYDLALFIKVPSIMGCFRINVLPDSLMEKERLLSKLGTLYIKYSSVNTRPLPGQTVQYKFQMIDAITNQPVSGLKDINVMDVMTTKNKRGRTTAIETEEKGTYVASILFDEEGLYYVYTECLSRKLTYNNTQFLMFYASKPKELK